MEQTEQLGTGTDSGTAGPVRDAERVAARLRAVLAGLAARVGTAAPRQPAGVRSPFTGAVIGAVPLCEPVDVEAAAGRARTAQRAWAATPLRERRRVLLGFHDLVLDRQAELLDVVQLEAGKSRRDAFEEVADAAIVARHYAFHGPRLLEARRRRGLVPLLTRAVERRVPLGVVALIAPWNYPLVLSASEALPALLAGNAVVTKPDAGTPFTALAVQGLLEQAGLPRDLYQVVTGEPETIGAALIGAADYVAFTGSTPTGRVIARQAAERLIGCSLELGGKNPLIVLADADLERAAAAAARGCFANAGQLCISVERVLVEAPVYDAFLSRFVAATRALRIGASFDFADDIGSLHSERQLGTVEAHVADALERGARVEAGGRRLPDMGPLFYEPTILSAVTPAMRVYAEETFGPVASVYAVRDAEEAVARANELPYGLNASLWTRDVRRGRALAARIEAGTVAVNDVYAATWGSVDAPMGGFKDSGLGRRHGAEGLLKYTQSQTIAVQRGLTLATTRVSADLVTRVLRFVRKVPGLR